MASAVAVARRELQRAECFSANHAVAQMSGDMRRCDRLGVWALRVLPAVERFRREIGGRRLGAQTLGQNQVGHTTQIHRGGERSDFGVALMTANIVALLAQ